MPDIPFPNKPVSGFIEYENESDVRPGDEVEIRSPKNMTKEKHVCVISTHKGNRLTIYDYENDELHTVSKEEFLENYLLDDFSYKRHIILRDRVNLSQSPPESLVLYLYAFENPVLEEKLNENSRALLFGWAFTKQNPVKDMPQISGRIIAPSFKELNKLLKNEGENECQIDGDFSEFIKRLDNELIESFLESGEFNARQLFEVDGEPSYSDELKERFKQEATQLQETVEKNSDVFV